MSINNSNNNFKENISSSSFTIKRSQTCLQNKFNSLNSRNLRNSFLDIEESLNNSTSSSSSLSPTSNKTRRSTSFRHTTNENYLTNLIQQQKPIPPNRTSSLNYRAQQPLYTKQFKDTDRNSIYSTFSLRSSTNTPLLLNSLNFETQSLNPLLTKTESNKIEQCYKSIGSSVCSSKCQAGLYTTNLQSLINLNDWKLEANGVPVWIFNSGLNPKRPKGLYFCIADKKTGFSLWKSNSLTYVNDFKWTRPGLITFKIVQDNFKKDKHMRVNKGLMKPAYTFAAIRFDDELECSKFYDFYRSLYVDSTNDDLFNPHYKPLKKASSFCNTIYKRITKNSISSPVAFNHVNSLSIVFEENTFCNNLNNTSSLSSTSSPSSSSSSASDTQSIVSEFTLTSSQCTNQRKN
ncbi:unnamed protein product [Brachionus calyciflorus]|uniref:Uncharacterized protein n=1 Tax=Brachionus calyciflorus TaxID=104777 RepID=A0A814H2Z7_9BILA|nr:unnamed protein product [Brachionus calyciflorus]